MILAVLEARCEVQFSGLDVYLNVAGGLKITETAADLAVAASLISAKENIILPEDFVFFGEVSLSGAIRRVSKIENRLKEAEKLGFKKVESPKNNTLVKGLNIEVFENLDLLSFVNKLSDGSKKKAIKDLDANV
jgi:DNA repair protein RadA/Sms